MRKTIIAFLSILVAACASRPAKLSGSYAVVFDPELVEGGSRSGTPLHEAVKSSLAKRIVLAPNAAEANVVIRLTPSTLGPDKIDYEIWRGGELITRSEPAGMVLYRDQRVADRAASADDPGLQRTLGESADQQRRNELSREGGLNRPPAPDERVVVPPVRDEWRTHSSSIQENPPLDWRMLHDAWLIADQIVDHLKKL